MEPLKEFLKILDRTIVDLSELMKKVRDSIEKCKICHGTGWIHGEVCAEDCWNCGGEKND